MGGSMGLGPRCPSRLRQCNPAFRRGKPHDMTINPLDSDPRTSQKTARTPLHPMEWHYADGQEKRGPVSDAEIQSLIVAGRILPATLVWTASFTQWKPAGESGFFPEALAESGTQTCLITGKNYPVA